MSYKDKSLNQIIAIHVGREYLIEWEDGKSAITVTNVFGFDMPSGFINEIEPSLFAGKSKALTFDALNRYRLRGIRNPSGSRQSINAVTAA
jgi:hypothetical protein